MIFFFVLFLVPIIPEFLYDIKHPGEPLTIQLQNSHPINDTSPIQNSGQRMRKVWNNIAGQIFQNGGNFFRSGEYNGNTGGEKASRETALRFDARNCGSGCHVRLQGFRPVICQPHRRTFDTQVGRH